MFRIDQHIEHLLLNHSCVIVPGFGGFVVHEVPARFDESDGMLLPPSTTVGFNPQLILNDSLLIQSFIEAYDMSYPEAQREVEHETQELRRLLAENHSFDIHSVGTLTLNSDGNYEFEPCQAGILAPRLYGLSGIDTNDSEAFATSNKQHVIALPATGIVNEGQSDDISEIEEENDERVFSITASTLKKVAVACIALVLLAAIPFAAQNDQAKQILSGVDLSFFTKLMPSTEVTNSKVTVEKTVVEKPAPKVVKIVKPAITPEAEAAPSEAETTAPSVEKPTYTIVLAAQVAQNNAEIFVNNLKAQDFKDVRIIGEGKGRKVVMGSFDSEEEAVSVRRSLAEKEEFSAAWVLKMN